MLSAWLLPEHVADVLPAQARHVEDLRRGLVDVARAYGCELVMPPLLEHLESLLSGAGRRLDLKTFKIVDQLSGRLLGVRADSTPQVARIDAHLLNHSGVTRLCYCGPVLHALPDGLHATREPLQFGAEIYGHAGLEADLEVLDLGLDCLREASICEVVLDLSDARIVRGILAGVMVGPDALESVYAALASKDSATLREAVCGFPQPACDALQVLITLYGDVRVLDVAQRTLPPRPLVQSALSDLRWLSSRIALAHPEVRISFDLADIGGNGYYTGPRFAAYVAESPDAVVRGGRYDEVGAAFGRNRAAVGFSLDVKALAAIAPAGKKPSAIRAPWVEDDALRSAVRQLRRSGQAVMRVLPGHEAEARAFDCDRELVHEDGQWIVREL